MHLKHRTAAVILAAAMITGSMSAVSAEELTGDIYDIQEEILTDSIESIPAEADNIAGDAVETAQEQEDLITSEIRVVRPDGDAKSFAMVRASSIGALDGEITDLITIMYNRSTGAVSGVTVQTYQTENGEDKVIQTIRWLASNGSWSYVGEDGSLTPISPAGAYNLLSNWSWNIGELSDNVYGGIGGYTVTVGEEEGIWNYYFTLEDVKSGAYKKELSGYFADLPDEFYIGVEGKQTGREGLHKVGTDYYFLEEDGSIVINDSRVVEGETYYFGLNGVCDNPPAPPIEVGWHEVDGEYYWMEESGEYITESGIRELDGKTYYLGEGGKRTTGFVRTGGKTYYFDPETGILQTGWITLEKGKYYANKKGEIFYNFHNIGSKKYYFRSDGTLMTDKESVYINKQYYAIDKNGVVTEQPRVIGLAISRLAKAGRNRWAAFKYAAGLTYVNRPALSGTEAEKLEAYATYGFETGKGNNIVMAACYYYMGKQLGLDIHYVTGKVPLASGKDLSHAWCEVVIDGKTLVVDPYCYYLNKKGAFLFEYGSAGSWRYTISQRVN